MQRDQETHAAIEDVELQTLELQALRSRLERELTQRQEEALYQLRSQHHTHMRSEGQSCGGDSGSQEEEEESRERMQEAQAKLARAQADRSLREAEEVTRLQREVDTLHQLHQQSKVGLSSLCLWHLLLTHVITIFSLPLLSAETRGPEMPGGRSKIRDHP